MNEFDPSECPCCGATLDIIPYLIPIHTPKQVAQGKKQENSKRKKSKCKKCGYENYNSKSRR